MKVVYFYIVPGGTKVLLNDVIQYVGEEDPLLLVLQYNPTSCPYWTLCCASQILVVDSCLNLISVTSRSKIAVIRAPHLHLESGASIEH